jgi:hypothetical protein
VRSSSSEERKNGARSNEGIEELGDDGCCLSSNAPLSLLQSGHFFSVVEVLGAVVEREGEAVAAAAAAAAAAAKQNWGRIMSDSEDADSHLLVDWKGDGGEAGGLRRQGVRRRASFSSAVQQTIGYKKVKQQRCSSPWKPEMKPEIKKVMEDDGKCSTVPADIRVQPTTIVLVSLSESEPSEAVVPPPRAAAATIFEPLKPGLV